MSRLTGGDFRQQTSPGTHSGRRVQLQPQGGGNEIVFNVQYAPPGNGPVVQATITIDGSITQQTDDTGFARFTGIMGSGHTAVISGSGLLSQTVNW